MTAQSESAIYNIQFIKEVQDILQSLFPYSTLYQAAIPTYPSGTWAFSMASKKVDPHFCNDPKFHKLNTFQSKYYNSHVHQAAFALPTWIQQKLHIALDSAPL